MLRRFCFGIACNPLEAFVGLPLSSNYPTPYQWGALPLAKLLSGAAIGSAEGQPCLPWLRIERAQVGVAARVGTLRYGWARLGSFWHWFWATAGKPIEFSNPGNETNKLCFSLLLLTTPSSSSCSACDRLFAWLTRSSKEMQMFAQRSSDRNDRNHN